MTKENENKKTSGYQVEVQKAFQQIEVGVKAVFESENYRNYLKTMAKFHKYSINNTMLISASQKERDRPPTKRLTATPILTIFLF